MDQEVEYGAHLPLIDLGAGRSLPALRAYARAAAELGYRYLCANDHLLFDRPWLDGPTALAALLEESGDLRLATTASLRRLRRRRHRVPGAVAAFRRGGAGAACPAPR